MHRSTTAALLALCLALSGCTTLTGGPDATPTPTPEATAAPTPAPTDAPTSAPTPEATDTPTPEPEATFSGGVNWMACDRVNVYGADFSAVSLVTTDGAITHDGPYNGSEVFDADADIHSVVVWFGNGSQELQNTRDCGPTPTPTATPTPSPTPEPAPTPTPTPTATPTPTPTPTPEPTIENLELQVGEPYNFTHDGTVYQTVNFSIVNHNAATAHFDVRMSIEGEDTCDHCSRVDPERPITYTSLRLDGEWVEGGGEWTYRFTYDGEGNVTGGDMTVYMGEEVKRP